MWTLHIYDLVKGLFVAILAGAFLSIVGIVGAENFDVFSADWVAIAKTAFNGGFAAFVGYIMKNLITADNGKVLGKF